MTQTKTEKQSPQIAQLHRLRGQLAGVEKMLRLNAKPQAVIQQLEAVRGNLKALEAGILTATCRDFKDAETKKICHYLLKLI